MKPRHVRRQPAGKLEGSSFEPYYRRNRGQQVTKGPRKFKIRYLLLWLIVIAALIALLGWGFAIKNIEVTGTNQAEAVRQQAQTQLNKHIGWSNLLLLDTNALSQALTDSQNQNITEVKVTKNWFSRGVIITATDRSQQLVWQTNNILYQLDQTGRVISQIGERGSRPLVVDGSNIPVTNNTQVASRQFVSFVTQVFADMPGVIGVNPTQSRIEQSTNELLVDTSGGYYIRFDTTQPAGEQLSEARDVIASAKAANISISHYIDVRLPYKAYYQ